MKSIALRAASAVAMALLSTTAIVSATTETFVFTADPDTGITAFNGSTITLTDTPETSADSTTSPSTIELIAWKMNGDLGYTLVSGDGSFVSDNEISSFDATTWTGSFQIRDSGEIVEFNGTNNIGEGTLFFPGTLNDQYVDPAGVWTPLGAVPDSGSTVQLLGVVLGGLTVCRRWARLPSKRS
jgi:VPDSG-CTERM motif